MDKITLLKVIGTGLGVVSTFLMSYVSDEVTSKEIEKQVNKKLEELNSVK